MLVSLDQRPISMATCSTRRSVKMLSSSESSADPVNSTRANLSAPFGPLRIGVAN